jgi:hypothetical protein
MILKKLGPCKSTHEREEWWEEAKERESRPCGVIRRSTLALSLLPWSFGLPTTFNAALPDIPLTNHERAFEAEHLPALFETWKFLNEWVYCHLANIPPELRNSIRNGLQAHLRLHRFRVCCRHGLCSDIGNIQCYVHERRWSPCDPEWQQRGRQDDEHYDYGPGAHLFIFPRYLII